MPNISKEFEKIGNFQVSVTPELRALFARTHREVSGTLPSYQQFDNCEQHELISVCREYMVKDGEPVEFNEEDYANNLCELLHFLFENDVPIATIHGDIRVTYRDTQQLSMRIGIEQKNASDEAKAKMSLEHSSRPEKVMASVAPVSSKFPVFQEAMV